VTTDGCSFRATTGTCENESDAADEPELVLVVVVVAWRGASATDDDPPVAVATYPPPTTAVSVSAAAANRRRVRDLELCGIRPPPYDSARPRKQHTQPDRFHHDCPRRSLHP
jgi:hypothetical protein